MHTIWLLEIRKIDAIVNLKAMLQNKFKITLLAISILWQHFDVNTILAQSAASQITVQKARDTIEQFVLRNLNLPAEDVLIEISDIEEKLEAKVNFDELQVLPSQNRIHKGIQMIKCGLFYHTQLQKIVRVKVRIKTIQTVVVSKVSLQRHTILEPETLTLNRRETTNIKQKIYTSIAEVAGLRTRRIIQTGEIISKNLVETIPVIQRGSEIEIRFQKGTLEITLPGVAREDGQLGENIRVKCLENKKNYHAEVIDSNTVTVNL
ncbi:MAG: flagellar basal body P-ring formation chaperone FlgA [bacterium]